MDHRKQNYTDPWDDQVYGTGNTMPPKSYSGIIALLLILVIFLSGVVSLLSFMNIKLFRQLSEAAREEAPHAPVSFSDLDIQPFPEMTAPTESLTIHSDVSISLNQSPQSIENIPQEGALSLQEIYEKNAPSVVSVICTGPEGSVTGTGVVLSRTGYILTTYFTVHRAESIDVHTHDGRSFQAQLLGGDLLTDLAVLKVDSSDLTPAEFGASGALRVGDAVCAIGDPLGAALGGSLSEGIISAIHTNALSRDFRISLIQSSAVPSTGTPGAGTGTPGTGTITPGTGAGTPGQGSGSASVNWAEIWANISGTATKIFSDIAAFLLNKDNLPIILIGALVLLVLIVILIIANSGKESSTIKMKTIPARTLPAIISATKKLPAPKYLIPDNCPRWLKKIIFWAPVHYNYGDVIISSPKGTEDDVILSAIEKPEELINYLNPIKPEPTEVAGYSAH
jgi:hypothetical protein